MKFLGEELNPKQEKVVREFLKGRFEDLLEDIDYYTDAYGRIVIANVLDIERELEVIG